MSSSNVARVVLWNADRGFGFAEANGRRYFVHISAFGHISRPPIVGDTIIVEQVGATEKGMRIEKGTLEGAAIIKKTRKYSKYTTKINNHQYYYNKKKLHSFISRRARSKFIAVSIISVCMLLLIGFNNTLELIGFNPNKTIMLQAQRQGKLTSKMDVARYICDNDRLPDNYVDKATGKYMYEVKTGNKFTKWNFNPLTTLGVMIGGDKFENQYGLLPHGYYQEADVDYYSSNRGTNRLVYTSDCNIYFTGNHYKTFTKLELSKGK